MDKYTLKNIFKKSFVGVVWRMEADTANGLFAVETRQVDGGTAAYSVIRYETGEFLLHEIAYGDRNWTLVGFVEGRILLRALGTDTPMAPGITCLDAYSGRVIWEQFNYVWLGLDGGEVIARHRNFAGGYEQRLDVHSGQIEQKRNIPNKPTAPPIVLPELHYGQSPAFLAKYSIYSDLVCCRVADKVVWGFHEKMGQHYQIRLVISNDIRVLADPIVLSGLERMIPELFFMIGSHLFMIGNNKREIIAYLV